jgi:hypothetical protein
MKLLTEITTMISSLVGNEYLYMDTPIQIKTTPHTPALNIWALTISPRGDLYVMNADEQWHQVDPSDEIIITSVYQRVSVMHSQYFNSIAS